MKKIMLSITLLISGSLYTPYIQNASIACPCVNKKLGGNCCCAGSDHACNCVETFEKNGSVPMTCPCPKTDLTKQESDLPHIEVSHGELFDKVTILEIKSRQITDAKKLNNIITELSTLNRVLNSTLEDNSAEKNLLLSLKDDLYTVNWELWQVEDALREKEAAQEFDAEFISLARSVYMLNDLRFSIKRTISSTLDSRIIEEKSYANTNN